MGSSVENRSNSFEEVITLDYIADGRKTSGLI